MAYDAVLRDTTVEAAKVYYAALAKKSVADRARMTSELSESVRRLAKAGVRRRMPRLTEREVELEVIRRAIGDPLFAKAFPTAK